MTWADWADHRAKRIHDAGQWRAPRDADLFGPTGTVAPDGRDVVSFASNDYLGLTRHPAVLADAHAALERWGAGAGSARLIVGSRPVHSELEAALAAWKGTEQAVLFTTGFAANLGVLATFADDDVLVCSDELNHASIIDGRRLSRAPLAVYRHRDVTHLDELLAASRAALLDQGLLVTAIRPPTVPPGTSRLRVTLSAAHTAEQVDRLACALDALFPR